MTEHPILFSGEMVRAILKGTKTQTRRVIKLPEQYDKKPKFDYFKGADGQWWNGFIKCPYGKVGDHLWVRETFTVLQTLDGTINSAGSNVPYDSWLIYRSDGDDIKTAIETAKISVGVNNIEAKNGTKWIPSIYMTRWASRLTLEITDIRVERVQDISEQDAKAEGITLDMDTGKYIPFYLRDHQCRFASLWDSINAERGYGWDANPWVWAITFRRVK